jgi:hypothetical protein
MTDNNGNKSLQRIIFENREYYIGYKVVTNEMKSLGLKRNPNIKEYPVNEWFYLPKDELERGKEDWGGIWVTKDQSGARNIVNYMRKKYSRETRVFKALLDKILHVGEGYSYRVKTNGVFLFEEITDRFL